MRLVTEVLSSVWDNLLGRTLILAAAVGWGAFYLLARAHSALVS